MVGVGVPFGAEQEDDGGFIEAHGLAVFRIVHDRQEGAQAGSAGLTAEKAMTALRRSAAARFFCLMEIPLLNLYFNKNGVKQSLPRYFQCKRSRDSWHFITAPSRDHMDVICVFSV